MHADEDSSTASSDELGIFIDGDGAFRIIVPKDWDPETGSGMCPEIAYLAVAALIRLGGRDPAFYAELLRWADTNIKNLDLTAKSTPKFN